MSKSIQHLGCTMGNSPLSSMLNAQEEAPDAVKNAIMNYFRDVKLTRRAPRPVSPEVVTFLSEFEGKLIYARRKENPKNRTLVYEFSRLDKDLQSRIDKAVREIFESYNEEKSHSSE
ncbi:ParB family protein [Photorhabdus asymbiotica]|uniref:ParB family protein n=1 Tax=Photorhabdus asymbiotica TaxID=291112 RepID=UPI003DA6E3AF